MTKVLLVDDEDPVRTVIALLLGYQGYEIIEAGYGKAGYAKAVEEQPDIILLDLMMPVMDGFDGQAKGHARDPAHSGDNSHGQDRCRVGETVRELRGRGLHK